MRHDSKIIRSIDRKLSSFEKNTTLPGLRAAASRECFVLQVIDSIRRVEYIRTISNKSISDSSIDPFLEGFNPLKAAVLHNRRGNYNEAFWLVFIATHFGKNIRTGWQLPRGFYSRLEEGPIWTWEALTENFGEFEEWMNANIDHLKQYGNFSNHRKYESTKHITTVVKSYIKWIGPNADHRELIARLVNEVGNDRNHLFNALYNDMSNVSRFGRTGKFDFLTMAGKLQLVDIEPGLTYMQGATGPIQGARDLFNKQTLSANDAEKLLAKLSSHLDLYFGMQVLEDALCNWQKSPKDYQYFKG